MADLTPDELTAARSSAPAGAKRFEKVETAAGDLIFGNASRAQIRATRIAMGDAKAAELMQARESLMIAMCVVPGPDALRALLEDWPDLSADINIVRALDRLNGAASK
jgi:hypothetical protein